MISAFSFWSYNKFFETMIALLEGCFGAYDAGHGYCGCTFCMPQM
jgi:hypothetical protein